MRNRFLFLLPTLALFCLAGPVSAADGKFQLVKTFVKAPEMPPAPSFTLVTDEHQVTFIPPHEAIVRVAGDQQEVQMAFPDDHCIFKMRVSSLNPALASSGSWDQLHDAVSGRYLGAEISAGSVCHTSCKPGCSFIVHQTTESRSQLVTRIAFVPFQGGMLEVSVTAVDSKFEAQQFIFTHFLEALIVEDPNPSTLSIRSF